MNVTFTLTKEERRLSVDEWLGRRLERHNRSLPPWFTPRRITTAWLIFGFVIIGWQFVVYPPAFRDLLDDLPAVVGPPLIWIVGARLWRVLDQRYSAEDSVESIAVDRQAIERIVDAEKSKIPWDDVTEIRLSSLAVVIMTEHSLDLIIPRRAFARTADALAFYQQARDYWQPPAQTSATRIDPSVWPPPPTSATPTAD